MKQRSEKRQELIQLKFKDAYSGQNPKIPSDKTMEESFHKRNHTISEKMNRMAFERMERTMNNREFLFKQMKDNQFKIDMDDTEKRYDMFVEKQMK